MPCVQVDDNEFEFLSLNFVHRGATPRDGSDNTPSQGGPGRAAV